MTDKSEQEYIATCIGALFACLMIGYSLDLIDAAVKYHIASIDFIVQ